MLTPLEIRKKEFNRELRGYSREEVRSFLDAVAAEIEELRREKAELNERLAAMTSRLEEYERTEKLLQQTLVTAQQATDELRAAAERDARTREEAARVQAERILLDARREADRIREQVRTLVARRTALVNEIAAVARTFLNLAESLEKKPDDDEPADTTEYSVDSQ